MSLARAGDESSESAEGRRFENRNLPPSRPGKGPHPDPPRKGGSRLVLKIENRNPGDFAIGASLTDRIIKFKMGNREIEIRALRL